ncbi:hypothetical protein BH23ACT10_BH23ACT10_08140 [soil metagenome]
MVLVPVELRAVSGLDGVFDSERMQSKGDGYVGERCDVRVVELDPQQGVPGAGFGQSSVEVLDDLGVRLMDQSATAHVSAMMPVPAESPDVYDRSLTANASPYRYRPPMSTPTHPEPRPLPSLV